MLRVGLGFWVLLLLVPPGVRAENLVGNGDFEVPLQPAWTAISTGECTIERDAGLDPDPDYEAHVVLSGNGYGRLLQIVAVPDGEVELSLSLRVMANATGEAWAGAAIVLAYLDEAQDFLGETRLGAWSRNCPWESGPDEHLISLPADMWLYWTLDISEELQELPAVDPLAVRYIRVGLYAQGYEC
jgi:hypothetical protein